METENHAERNQPVPITGVWIRSQDGRQVTVLVEIAGVWRQVYAERILPDETISQIVHVLGLRQAPPDPWTAELADAETLLVQIERHGRGVPLPYPLADAEE